jgi:WD40 repeat protein
LPGNDVEPVRAIFFRNGETVTVGGDPWFDTEVTLWNAQNGKVLAHRPVDHATVASDGTIMVTSEKEPDLILLQELRTGGEIRRLRTPKPVLPLDFSPDGKVLYAQVGAGHVLHLSTENGRVLRETTSHFKDDAAHVEYDGLERYFMNGKFLTAKHWHRNTWGTKCKAQPLITARNLATGMEYPTFQIPHPQSWWIYDVHVEFSRDGKTMVLAVERGQGIKPGEQGKNALKEIHLFETATGRQRALLKDLRGRGAWAYYFSYPDRPVIAVEGRLVALADEPEYEQGPIRLWDSVSGREVGRFQPTANVTCLAFSPDRRFLASGLADTTTLLWDLASMNRDLHNGENTSLDQRELKSLWNDLADTDARKAFLAIHRLAADPKEAVPFLRELLRPVPPIDGRKFKELVVNLDSGVFAEREQATRELARLGSRAALALREALAGAPSLEFRRRAEALLQKLERMSAIDIRQWRALETLELMATPDARRLLAELAQGARGAWVTEEARAALSRLSRIHPLISS